MSVTVNHKSPIQDYVHPDDHTNLLITLVSYLLAFFKSWPYFVLDSVQFSSLLFSQNKLQYKNTYKNCKLAREPRRNQKAHEGWAPQSQRNK